MWLHAKDTAQATITIIESNKVNEIYNICGDYEQKNIDTVKKILDIYHNNSVNYNNYIDFTYSRVGQDVRYSVDDSKLRKLNWKANCNFDEELKEIIEYYREIFIW